MKAAVLALCVLSVSMSAQTWAQPPVRSAYDFVRRHGHVRFLNGSPAPEAPRQPSRAPFLVGETKTFWSWDLSVMPPRDVEVPATCRAVGEHTYVFVADDQWGSNVDQDVVDTVAVALESLTPGGSIHPDQGIVPNEIEVFGQVPDALDGDPKVFILLMELKSFGGQQFDGFFNAFNQYPDEETMAQEGYHSNEVEMVTINSAIRPADSDMTLSIFAHEFQHLIHWGADEDEVGWVDESMAEAAMTINGYYTDQAWLQDYLHAPESALYEAAQVHYGACLLFGSYLYERFGADFLRSLVADAGKGEAGFEASLAALDSPIGMDELLLDWATATIGDSLGCQDPRYSHPLLEVGQPDRIGMNDDYPSPAPLAGSLSNTGTAYWGLGNPDVDVRVLLDSTPADGLLARVIMVDPQGQVWTGAFERGALEIPFADSAAQDAWVVLLARPGQSVSYSLEAELVDDPGLDGGADGEADGGSDAGGDAGPDDAGADDDAGCPPGQEQVRYDGEPVCVPVCTDGQSPRLEAGSWVCAGGSNGCGCVASGSPAGGLGGLLLMGFFLRHRRKSRR